MISAGLAELDTPLLIEGATKIATTGSSLWITRFEVVMPVVDAGYFGCTAGYFDCTTGYFGCRGVC